jgi:hypothetical protein
MSQPSVSQPTVSEHPEKRDWIPIIVGAIAALLGGGILASIFNSFISYVNAPNVQILIKPDGKHNGNNAWILMVNIVEQLLSTSDYWLVHQKKLSDMTISVQKI